MSNSIIITFSIKQNNVQESGHSLQDGQKVMPKHKQYQVLNSRFEQVKSKSEIIVNPVRPILGMESLMNNILVVVSSIFYFYPDPWGNDPI